MHYWWPQSRQIPFLGCSLVYPAGWHLFSDYLPAFSGRCGSANEDSPWGSDGKVFVFFREKWRVIPKNSVLHRQWVIWLPLRPSKWVVVSLKYAFRLQVSAAATAGLGFSLPKNDPNGGRYSWRRPARCRVSLAAANIRTARRFRWSGCHLVPVLRQNYQTFSFRFFHPNVYNFRELAETLENSTKTSQNMQTWWYPAFPFIMRKHPTTKNLGKFTSCLSMVILFATPRAM